MSCFPLPFGEGRRKIRRWECRLKLEQWQKELGSAEEGEIERFELDMGN